ncbi:unnamed protein product, partial [Mesorhabditis belari]|uniref:Gamma-glutamyltranspeptidase 1 n=1 Tax=Mesorhabditis belari TaxID=2138241 RepID=A0AAF3FHJ9_9BILA
MFSRQFVRITHSFECLLAVFLNFLMLYFIMKKTHPVIGKYSYLLFCFSAFDILYVTIDFLIVPLIVPLFCNYIPLTIINFSAMFGVFFDLEPMCILIMIDPILEPLVMIYFIKCYRDAFMNLIFCRGKRLLNIVSSTQKYSVPTNGNTEIKVGRNVLLAGGNAVDAGVAALFCLGATDAHSSGIGGGHFMTIYQSASQSCFAIDAREVAPAAATEDMYVGKWNDSEYGWRAVAVPSELHGLWTAYEQFGSGKVPWNRLIEPTVQLLTDGVPVSSHMQIALQEYAFWITKEPTMKEFVNPDTGDVYTTGDQVKRLKLAETLRRIASESDPIKFFYDSDELTQPMVDEFQKNGGLLTRDDFRNYKSIVYSEKEMMVTTLPSGRKICGPPPPSSAAVAVGILQIMDQYKNSLEDFDSIDLFLHRFIESAKFAYSGRTWLGDPKFVTNATEIARNLTTRQWADWARSRITDKAHDNAYYGGSYAVPPPDHGTTHLSVIDKLGNAVSITSTINIFFGAKIMSESTGIIWNDEMDDFSSPGHPNYFGFEPSPANFIRPGKRPLSSMCPLVIADYDGSNRLMAVGAAGGSTIITGTAAIALHTMWLNQTVKEAVDFPRVHNQLEPNYTYYETELPPEFVQALQNRGQTMMKDSNLTEATAAIREVDGQLYANSDFRKGQESAPAGY